MFDPLTQSWTDPCPNIVLPHEREKHLMVPVKKDQIYIMSGKMEFLPEVGEERFFFFLIFFHQTIVKYSGTSVTRNLIARFIWNSAYSLSGLTVRLSSLVY